MLPAIAVGSGTLPLSHSISRHPSELGAFPCGLTQAWASCGLLLSTASGQRCWGQRRRGGADGETALASEAGSAPPGFPPMPVSKNEVTVLHFDEFIHSWHFVLFCLAFEEPRSFKAGRAPRGHLIHPLFDRWRN